MDSVDTFSFRIPTTALRNRPLRFRLVSDFANNSITGPCYSPQYGQVEDFAIVFSSPDTVPPQVRTRPADTLYLDQNGKVTAFADRLDAGSTDNVDIDSLYLSQADFDCADIGTSTYYLIARDASANTDSAALSLTIADTSSPVVRAVDTTLYLDQNGRAGLTTDLLKAAASDNCAVDSLALSQDSFSCSDLGANQVVFSVFDSSGNSAGKTSTVTLLDTLVPTIVDIPADSAFCALDESGAAFTYAVPTSLDNCPTSTQPISGPASGEQFPVGTTTLVFGAADSAGNQARDSFTITVLPLPENGFTYSIDGDTLNVAADEASLAAYTWSFGDGTVDNTSGPLAQHVYASSGTYTVKLRAANTQGCLDSSRQEVSLGVTALSARHGALDAVLFPNPTTGNATLRFRLPHSARVRLSLHDMQGRQLLMVAEQRQLAGPKTLTVPTAGLADGFYLLRMQIDKAQHLFRLGKR